MRHLIIAGSCKHAQVLALLGARDLITDFRIFVGDYVRVLTDVEVHRPERDTVESQIKTAVF